MKICILIKKCLFPAQGGVLALMSEIISDENVITTFGNEATPLCTFNSPSVCSYKLDTLKVFNTHMQTKHIVFSSAWWSTHYFHLAVKCISSRKRMWRALDRESTANQHRGAVRTEVFYCTWGCFPSCLGRSEDIRMALFFPNSAFR